MHVVATAGHVDHGKSTLVRTLTGMEPDRWAEERRRGLTIDLGFAWTRLPSGEVVAFVDVPGHERFVSNMLAGVGPAPAVLFVVAADEGWMPQTEEHARAVACMGHATVALVVTKCDAAPAEAVADDASQRLAKLGIAPVATAVTSAITGEGLDDVRRALRDLLAATAPPDPDAPLRFWIDRVFTIRGAGTVVTGTLAGGSISLGEALRVMPADTGVVVRGMQCLGEDVSSAEPTARVALNLRGIGRDELHRGMALVSPDRWTLARSIDVIVTDPLAAPRDLVAHIGSASVTAQVRRLGTRAARLRLAHALPLHIGDRLLLRDPASRHLVAADVADLDPPMLRRRGDATRVAATLMVPRNADDEVRRRGVVAARELVARGFDAPPQEARLVGDHWVDDATWAAWRDRLAEAVATAGPDGLATVVAMRRLGAPVLEVITALADELPSIEHVDGCVRRTVNGAPTAGLEPLLRRLGERPFDPPGPEEVAAMGFGPADVARAVRAGAAVKVSATVVLAAAAIEAAIATLATLPQPFTVADARTALGSTRRIVVPLLEHLDARRRTVRHADGTRTVVVPA